MENIVNRNGITFHFIRTEKYKTNTIVFKMLAPLIREEATSRALLAYCLQSGTNTYPTTRELRSYLEQLYGATFNVNLQKKGENHILSFSLEVANEKFLFEKEPLLEKALHFLREILLNPKTNGEAFDEGIVQKEKRTLKQRIEAIYDDKIRYANMRLIEEMCKNEPYAINVYGVLEDVDRISPNELYEYYQKALSEDQLDLYIIGDFNEEEILEQCERFFSFSARTERKRMERKVKKEKNDPMIIERQDIQQGKLNIGYRTNISYGDYDYFALQVFNGLFGGFPHSKLFLNVREKASLAYYAVSRLESHKGLLMVMTGIEPKNYEQALSIIKEQMEAMKSGNFSEEELVQTKAVIKNQMLETLDTPQGTIEVLYHNVISKKNIDKEKWFEGIEKVTKEEVLDVAKKIQFDTIYFLTGMEE
ncbi:EF-P 5-aminopentanol modification-associated protein YfmF [Fervidibacillus halotolerans]|uniref:Insulinase family protein n=1 Tax=Fervidibacillus halotolerans TaxID=2980027 RepID=A0A9E8RY84_9BACI|nr:pitrilysin family protein [Fervidibacillus halotolerans]WAA13545.1 insulinase family protein [Fervidibacillus halotolerans]